MFLFITFNQVNHKDNHFTEISTWFLTFPPFPFSGYEALGDFFNRKNRQSTAPPELYDRVRCVRSAATEDCDLGSKMWSNAGTWGKYYISVWSVNSRSNHFETSFFYANDNHNSRPNVRAKCLKRNAVREL